LFFTGGIEMPDANPFLVALQAIEPDFKLSQVGPAFAYERAAALVNLPPRIFLAWVRGEYRFRTFNTFEGVFRDGIMVTNRRLPQRKACAEFLISPSTLAELKKCLDAEPRPFPPFKKAKAAFASTPAREPS
jgi:hypothetical protein